MRVANAPCSWGVLEFEDTERSAPFAKVLDEIASTGYAGTELGDWGFMPTDPTRLVDELSRRGLAMLGAFVPVLLKDAGTHAAGVETAVRTAGLLAASSGDTSPLIVLADDSGTDPARIARTGRIIKQDSLSPDEWTTFARGCETIARAVKEQTGLRTVFHPHCAGFVETPWEIDELMKRTDPSLLGLCFDTGHLSFGGGNPLSVLRQYLSRVWHVHFKDFHPGAFARVRAESLDYSGAIRHGIFCELGKGSVEFNAVLTALRAENYRDWIVVEQDVLPGMGAPAESARRNREYLRGLGV
jgi:inosose dehydratase